MLHSNSAIRKTSSHLCCRSSLSSSQHHVVSSSTKLIPSIGATSLLLEQSSCKNERCNSTTSSSSGHNVNKSLSSLSNNKSKDTTIEFKIFSTKKYNIRVNLMMKPLPCPKTGRSICHCSSIPSIISKASSTVSFSTSTAAATTFKTNKKCPKTGNDICRCSIVSNNHFNMMMIKPSPCPKTGRSICHCSQSISKVSSTASFSTSTTTTTSKTNNKCPKTGNDVCRCPKVSNHIIPLTHQISGNISYNEKVQSKQVNYFSTTPAPPGSVMVTIDDAISITTKALQNIGWDINDATVQAKIMVHAELCGNNQGLVKMYQPDMMKPARNCSKPTLERNYMNSCVVNGNQSPGMVTAMTATNTVMEKLQSNNDLAIAIVSSYNSSTSSGQLGYYVECIAKHGYIGVAMCNSPELVVAAKGSKSTFGTNPIAISIPQSTSSLYPFTFDMATSAIALFGVLTSKSKGEPLPDHVAFDKDGNWTTNANMVLDDGGSIATFGGHKGMGLSLCVELLAGALSGSAVLGQVPSKKLAKSWGHTFIAIRHELLVDDYPNKVSSIIQTVKDSGPAVRIPGERSIQTTIQRQKDGIIPIPEKIWESITKTASTSQK